MKINQSNYPIEGLMSYFDTFKSWVKNTYGRKLFILDEGGTIIQKRSPMAKINLMFLREFQTLRHEDLSLIMLAPDQEDLDSYLFNTDILDVTIKKPNFENPKIGVWVDRMEGIRIPFTDIPATSIFFEQKYTSFFEAKSPNLDFVFKDDDAKFLYQMYSKNRNVLTKAERKRLQVLRDKIVMDYLEKARLA
jgi:hypothetical protein